MKLEIRKKKIEQYREKGLTYEEIGGIFKITAERVRQILTYNIEFCERHNRKFITECSYCKTDDDYVNKVKEIARENLIEEIYRLSKQGRRRELVMQRVALIKTLKDHYNFTFSQIAKLMERNLSTIKYLYHK